jgi:hypothetical protein
MKTCIFVTSFQSRSNLIQEFARRFEASKIDLPLLVFCDEAAPEGMPNAAEWIQDTFSFTSLQLPIALIYRSLLRISCRIRRRARPYSNNPLGYSPLWGQRLRSAINLMLQRGYTHAIWCCDDSWFGSTDLQRLHKIMAAVAQHKPGYFRLTESLSRSTDQTPFRKLGEDVLELLPSAAALPCHYVSHQTCLWDLQALAHITRPLDCACRHENSGTYRFHQAGFRAMEYEGDPVIPSLGVFGDGGFDTERIKH